MNKVRVVLALTFVLSASLSVAAQDSASSPSSSAPDPKSAAPAATSAPAQTEPLPTPALTLNDVIDRVVQREHYFMAQMRHLHPLVETYLQDLKNDPNGNPSPVKDQYFLGRLDMTDGPEDISFVGQPGFGHLGEELADFVEKADVSCRY